MKELLPRRWRSLFALVLLCLSLFYACKKNSDQSSPNRSLSTEVLKAKTWYEANFSNSSKSSDLKIFSNGSSSETTDLTNVIKPDWNNADTYSRFDDDVIELPVDPSFKMLSVLKNGRTGTAYDKKYSRSSFLLLRKGETYFPYVMTIIADSTYVQGDMSKLDRNHYNKRDADFSGAVLYFTPKGKFVNGWLYENGNVSSQLKGGQQSNQTAINASNVKVNLAQIIEVCTDWYQWSYDSDGNVINYQFLDRICHSYVVDIPDGVVDIPGGGGGSGSGGGGTTSPTPTNPDPPMPCNPIAVESVAKVQQTGGTKVNLVMPPDGGDGGFPPPEGGTPCPPDLKNQLKDCNGAVVDKLFNSNLENKITDIIQKTFNRSPKLNLRFVENTNIGNRNAMSDLKRNSDGSLDVIVFVNTAYLPANSSQEYKASTFLHEVLHGYFQYEHIDFNNQVAQHGNIANIYADDFAKFLQDTFGSSVPDSYSLAFNGLNDYKTANRTDYDNLLSKKGLNDHDQQLNSLKQREGMTGKKCD